MNRLFKALVLPNRIGRLQFIKIYLCLILAIIILGIIYSIAAEYKDTFPNLQKILNLIVLFYAAFHFSYVWYGYTKRLHDLGLSGWLIVWLLVPGANIIFLLVLIFMPGNKRDNRFGPKPGKTSDNNINQKLIKIT